MMEEQIKSVCEELELVSIRATPAQISIGRPLDMYNEVNVSFDVTTWANLMARFAEMYTSVLNAYCNKYEADENLLFFNIDLTVHQTFLAWLQNNNFVHSMYSGFIMEGKTELCSEYSLVSPDSLGSSPVFNYLKLLPSRSPAMCYFIRETDELWRAKNKINERCLLENQEDLCMIRFLWISAYMKQLYLCFQLYTDVRNATFFIFCDRASFDHDIFDYAYDSSLNTYDYLEELIVNNEYKLTTSILACILATPLKPEESGIINMPFYINRISKRVPWPLLNIPGREFEYNFYKDYDAFARTQDRFYALLDICLEQKRGLMCNFLPHEYVVECLNHLVLTVIQSFPSEDTEEYLQYSYAAYEKLYKLVNFGLEYLGRRLKNDAWYTLLQKIGLDGYWTVRPHGRRYKRIESASIAALGGFWGGGKTEILLNEDFDLKLFEISELWRMQPELTSAPAIMFGAWLCMIYNKLSCFHGLSLLSSPYARSKGEVEIGLDRTPLCFALFYNMHLEGCPAEEYVRAFRAIFFLHIKDFEMRFTWHDDVATVPWPIYEHRELEKTVYVSLKDLRDKKFIFYKFLDKLPLKFQFPVIFPRNDAC